MSAPAGDYELMVWEASPGRWLVTLFDEGHEAGSYGPGSATRIEAVQQAWCAKRDYPSARININSKGVWA